MNSLHLERQRRIEAWEANLREREEAIEAFQTKEFIDFALSSAQTAQRITNKEEELKFEEEMLHSEKLIIMQNIEELKKIRSNLETQHRLIETRERLDVSADLASLDARDEHLRGITY
jgi:glutaredoxin 2